MVPEPLVTHALRLEDGARQIHAVQLLSVWVETSAIPGLPSDVEDEVQRLAVEGLRLGWEEIAAVARSMAALTDAAWPLPVIDRSKEPF